MADIHWIKLKTSMFDDEKIRLIEAMPEADSILIIWVRLLVLAGKTNDDGLIYIQRDMPYTNESLATLFNKKVSVVTLAINLLVKFNMIDVTDEGLLEVTNWEKHQNVEQMEHVRKLTAARTKRYRENKKMKQIGDANGDVTVTSRDATDSDSDSDSDSEEHKPEIHFKIIIDHLNKMSGHNYRNVKSNHTYIEARINEGFTENDLIKVIDYKSSKWKNNPDMVKFLRPNTLFAPSHFDDYLNEANAYMGASNASSLQQAIKRQLFDYGDDTNTILINLQQLGYKVTRKEIEDERNRE